MRARAVIEFVVVSFLTAITTPSFAAAQRTFVASAGNDTHACSLTQPCRSFAAAIAKTNAGGEVIVLDSAGYGTVTITQGVSIIAPAGVYAGISVFSGVGITIDAAGVTVRLVGLSINEQGSSSYGIDIVAANEVSIERARISGFRSGGSAGVHIGPYPGQLLLRDSFVADNYIGVDIDAGSSTAEVAVDATTFQNNGSGAIAVQSPARLSVHGSHFSARKEPFDVGFPQGISVAPDVAPSNVGPVEVHVTDSVFDGVVRAIDATRGFATYASVSVARSEISHANTGIIVSEGASVAIEDVRFVHDDAAIFIDTASDLFTAGNNYMAYCGTYITGPGTLHAPAGFQ
jgi:hypothetical protein